MLANASAGPDTSFREVDVDDLLDDPELERLHAERLAAMQKEAEKRMVLQRKGHGELQEVHSSLLMHQSVLNLYVRNQQNIVNTDCIAPQHALPGGVENTLMTTYQHCTSMMST